MNTEGKEVFAMLIDRAWLRLLHEKPQNFFVAIPSVTTTNKILPVDEVIHNAMARKIFYSKQ